MNHIKLRHTYGSGHLHGLSAPGLDLEIALEPDALHRETQRRLSGSEQSQPLILERGYSQLDHLTLRSPDTTSQQSYQYDALGRMSFRSLQGDPAEKVIAYSYDAAGRLIGSQHGDNAHRYSVDAAGNRLEQGFDKQQGLTDNRLTQLNGAHYCYDGANRLVHLIHASELGATREATYRYDGLGRRISKTVRHTTATTHYGWDGDRIVREETDSQRTTVVYEPGSFVPMLRIDDTQQGQVLSAYITDALGTPMQLVTPNGQPRWLAEPDDWAAVKNQRAVRNVTQPIRFQGQWHDEESGLYYNRHRYYDPQQGRYISQDPIGLKGGMNHYNYAGNDPINSIDPKGLKTEVIIFEGVGWGGSSFGHVATNIDDTIYSWGPSGMSVMPYQDYMDRNTFRNAKGYTLNLSPEEQAQLEHRLMWQKGKGSYGALGFNCTDPLERGLEDLGYDLGVNITPGSLHESISANGLIASEVFYGRNPNLPAPGPYQSAPWAGW